MTDEEKAKEWVRTNSGYSTKEFHGQKAIEAFLAGLEAGREAEIEYVKNNALIFMREHGLFPFVKGHKVADGDLPKDARYVWTNVGPSYYDAVDSCWRDEFGRTQGVIAWCEPKFEE